MATGEVFVVFAIGKVFVHCLTIVVVVVIAEVFDRCVGFVSSYNYSLKYLFTIV